MKYTIPNPFLKHFVIAYLPCAKKLHFVKYFNCWKGFFYRIFCINNLNLYSIFHCLDKFVCNLFWQTERSKKSFKSCFLNILFLQKFTVKKEVFCEFWRMYGTRMFSLPSSWGCPCPSTFSPSFLNIKVLIQLAWTICNKWQI